MTKKKISNEGTLFKILKSVLQYPKDDSLPITTSEMDDCALIKLNDHQSLAVSSDFVRGSGFTLFHLGKMNYFDAGYYLISANLSDLAAIGASPTALTTVIRYAHMDDTDFEEVFKGMKAAGDVHSTPIIGGDIGSYVADVFTATAFGIVETQKSMLRGNARKGDVLCVTGMVGRAFTALLYFSKCKEAGYLLSDIEEEELLAAWRRPQARIKQGILLGSKFSNCCQDISDGLKATLDQLSYASSVGFTIIEEQIPIHSATTKLAEMLGIHPLEIACSASVDFELLFTVSKEDEELCKEEFSQYGFFFRTIGYVNNEGENVMLNNAGKISPVPGMPYDQRPIEEIIQAVLSKK